MVDHVRTLLINRDADGYAPVSDEPSDRVLALFGVAGSCLEADAAVVDAVLPLALAPDLSWFSSRFDRRTTPPVPGSVYRTSYEACCQDGDCVQFTLDGLYDRVLGDRGRWVASTLFAASDPLVRDILSRLRETSMGADGACALGAVLLACAYRRDVLRNGGSL